VANLTIVIPTLGRPGLLNSLKQLSRWKESNKNTSDSIEIIVFHNAKAISASSLSSEALELILELSAKLIIGDRPFEGAELSFRQALSFVKAGYVLPLTDDNVFLNEAFNAAIEVVNRENFDWVHFNSITNSNSNFLISSLFYECEATELINRIGVNFSLCCISRSLFRIEDIDFALWDELITKKQSVFSFAVILAISFNKKRVALCQLPIENRSIHSYDTSMHSWERQWKAHAKLNSDKYLNPFTVHLSALHEELINSKVLDVGKMEYMVVMEANILRPLYVEMTNLSFMHAYSLIRENDDPAEFILHLERLKRFFPNLINIYNEICVSLRTQKKSARKKIIVRAENQYRFLIGGDNFNLSKLFGDSFTNVIKHPQGEMREVVFNNDNDWRSIFFIFVQFNKQDLLNGNNHQNCFKLRFDISNDPFYMLTRGGTQNMSTLRFFRYIPFPILLFGQKYLPSNVKKMIVYILRRIGN
jgi:hypothetical protein